MSVSVLVATPHQAFGELLHLSLEEEGRYRVHLVGTGLEAVDALKDASFHIAILDGDLKDMPVSELGSQLLSRAPGLKVVLIPPENDPKHASLAGMIYHGYVLRPFYLPDLLEMMESLTGRPAAEPELQGDELPEPDETQDAGRFEEALAATSALAGIALLGKERCLTHGNLPETVAGELKSLVERSLNNGERTDLVRFVRLPGQTSDHLFYITPVSEHAALGLAYPVGTPLSRVRVQAGQVAEALRPPAPKQPAAVAVRAAVRSWAEAAANPPAPEPEEEEPLEEGEEDAARTVNLAALLGAVPPPNPGEPSPSGWVPEISMSLPRPENESLFPWDNQAPVQPSVQPVPLEPRAEADATRPVTAAPRPAPAAPLGMAESLEVTRPVLAGSRPEVSRPADPAVPPERAKTAPLRMPAPAPVIEEPPVDELEDTRPRVLTSLTNFQQLVPASPGFSLLSYTCVLIPRLPQHHLTGGLSAQAGQWVQQLCVAFGWRLEGIAIRPEYLQWTVQVSPSIAPANLIRILRARISEMIFENYPMLARQNPSGDFWATGYLIVSGMQPPSPRLLRDYLAETRRRQGLNFPGGEPLVQTGGETTGLPDAGQATFRPY